MSIVRHGRQTRRAGWRTLLTFIGGALVVVLIAGAGVAGITVWQLKSQLDANTVDLTIDTVPPPPTLAGYQGGFNILLVGSDTRSGQGGIGGNDTSALNDVNMLLHVAQDQKSATLVSFPRDMLVPIPACSNGGPGSALPMNTALYYGGGSLNCVVATVEGLTGLKIQFASMITFTGVIAMSDAVGGVDVCVNGKVDDSDSGLHLPHAGTYTLKGFQALAFLRSRHGIGDGSDISRISSQQVYLSSLVRKIKSDGTLDNPVRLYGLAQAATKHIQLSKNFAQLDTLVSIALVLKNIPLQNIVMVQFPNQAAPTDPNKVAPNWALANQLNAALKADKPIALDSQALQNGMHGGSQLQPGGKQPTSTPSPGASPTPTETPVKGTVISGLKGQTAAQETCSIKYHY